MDRIDFEKKLKQIFCFTCLFDTKVCVKALIENDTEKLSEIRKVKAQMEACVEAYLKKWDAAETDEERKKVAGQVKATDYLNF